MYDRNRAQELKIFSAYSVRNLFDTDTPYKVLRRFDEVISKAFEEMPELVSYIRSVGTASKMIETCVEEMNNYGYIGEAIVEKTNMRYLTNFCYFPLLKSEFAYEELCSYAGIYLNSEHIKNLEEYEEKLIKRQNGGWWSKGVQDIGYSVAHEVGHAIDSWLHISSSRELALIYKVYPLAISKYGAFSYKEFFAEAYAEYSTGESPRETALAVKQLVDAAVLRERAKNKSENLYHP
ncbi:MAG: hypothetical protein K2I79_03000 [Clostridia bacterium]|nr:hypothetical protein [Clostridia bacterium]